MPRSVLLGGGCWAELDPGSSRQVDSVCTLRSQTVDIFPTFGLIIKKTRYKEHRADKWKLHHLIRILMKRAFLSGRRVDLSSLTRLFSLSQLV